MILRELLRDLQNEFQLHGFENPAIEARHLLLEALNITLNDIVLKSGAEVDSASMEKIKEWKSERLRGIPLGYIAGTKAFHKYNFKVRPGVLVPRPETELVVDVALVKVAKEDMMVADLGCGSGCIGLTILKERPKSWLVAVDSSFIATEVTTENAHALKVENRARIVNESVENWKPDRSFDLVVANPPYIADGDPRVEIAVNAFEPHEALYAGADGLDCVRAWTEKAFKILLIGGALVLEFGAGQSEQVEEIMKKAGFSQLRIEQDLAGHDRVISGFKTE